MTSPMLEKAARAAYEKFPDVEWQPGRVAGAYLTWDELLPADRRKKISFMRVAFLAIREPDEAMLEAAIAPYRYMNSPEFNAAYKQVGAKYMATMIDAILGEAPKS